MDALKIAFETIFVGVLALPWLALAAELFFPHFSLSRVGAPEGWFTKLQSIKSEAAGYAAIGVLSVAMAYTLGAAVSRLAQDFFNDDDLLLGGIPTEDRIRASVYCNPLETALVEIRVPPQDDHDPCAPDTSRWFHRKNTDDQPSRTDRILQIFDLQEAALLLIGSDKVSKLRLLHQQIMVLRGAAFDGLITWLLWVLAWNAKRDWKRWALPSGLLVWVICAFWKHFQLFQDRHIFQARFDDPPFMEITLLLLCVGGWYMAVKRALGTWPRGVGWVLFLFTALAYSGWYWTEILYDRLVIYSFYASQNNLLN